MCGICFSFINKISNDHVKDHENHFIIDYSLIEKYQINEILDRNENFEQLLLKIEEVKKLLEIRKKNIDILFKDLINRINQIYKNFEKTYINYYKNLNILQEKCKNEFNKIHNNLKNINSLQNLEHFKDTFDIEKTIINLNLFSKEFNDTKENIKDITKFISSITINSFNYDFIYKCENVPQRLNISHLDNVDFSIDIQKQENNIICITVPYYVEEKNELYRITKKTILFPLLINNEFGKFEKTRKLNQNKIIDNQIKEDEKEEMYLYI